MRQNKQAVVRALPRGLRNRLVEQPRVDDLPEAMRTWLLGRDCITESKATNYAWAWTPLGKQVRNEVVKSMQSAFVDL